MNEKEKKSESNDGLEPNNSELPLKGHEKLKPGQSYDNESFGQNNSSYNYPQTQSNQNQIIKKSTGNGQSSDNRGKLNNSSTQNANGV